MLKPSLLIVDDEKPTREGLRAALEDRYDVYLADDAQSALVLLEKDNFDVLLPDLRLPGEDGMKLIARAKSPFQPPLAEWLRRDLRAMVGEVLSDDRVRALGFLRLSGIAALKSEHFAGRANHGFKLWLLLNLVEWHRLFVEGQWTARLAGGRSRPSGPERATRPAPGR